MKWNVVIYHSKLQGGLLIPFGGYLAFNLSLTSTVPPPLSASQSAAQQPWHCSPTLGFTETCKLSPVILSLNEDTCRHSPSVNEMRKNTAALCAGPSLFAMPCGLQRQREDQWLALGCSSSSFLLSYFPPSSQAGCTALKWGTREDIPPDCCIHSAWGEADIKLTNTGFEDNGD